MAAQSFARVGYKNAAEEFEALNLRAQDIVATNGVSVEVHITDTASHLTTSQAGLIANAIQQVEKGAINGVATLDGSGTLTSAQIPPGLIGGMTYQGRFDPTTGEDGDGNPLPTPAAGNKGYFWIASEDGDWTPPGASAPMTFTVGDWAVSSGERYDKIRNTTVDAVARQMATDANTAAGNAQSAAGNAQTAADNAQTTANSANTAAGNAQTAANNAMTEAQLLDAAYCTDETDMASKNLRVGAIVLMQVENDVVDPE